MDCLVCGMQVAQLHNVHVGQIVPPWEANEQLCFCGGGIALRSGRARLALRAPALRAATAVTRALEARAFLDDLRDQIGAHYSVQLFELSRQQHLHASADYPDYPDTKVDDQTI